MRVKALFALRLGEPTTGELTDASTGVYFRVFERGLVAVNPDMINNKVLAAAPPIPTSNFVDVFTGESTNFLAVPKYSGRVFLFAASLDYGLGRLTP
jgi:hypothetical protein